MHCGGQLLYPIQEKCFLLPKGTVPPNFAIFIKPSVKYNVFTIYFEVAVRPKWGPTKNRAFMYALIQIWGPLILGSCPCMNVGIKCQEIIKKDGSIPSALIT